VRVVRAWGVRRNRACPRTHGVRCVRAWTFAMSCYSETLALRLAPSKHILILQNLLSDISYFFTEAYIMFITYVQAHAHARARYSQCDSGLHPDRNQEARRQRAVHARRNGSMRAANAHRNDAKNSGTPACSNIPKVSALVHLLYNITTRRTFENVSLLPAAASAGGLAAAALAARCSIARTWLAAQIHARLHGPQRPQAADQVARDTPEPGAGPSTVHGAS
jgi:hypothetical protein